MGGKNNYKNIIYGNPKLQKIKYVNLHYVALIMGKISISIN